MVRIDTSGRMGFQSVVLDEKVDGRCREALTFRFGTLPSGLSPTNPTVGRVLTIP